MRSWRIGTAFGIGVYVHWTFLLLPLWVLFSQAGAAGWETGAFMLGLVTALFGCVVLHELGHALMARAFGIRTHDITLYPIGGVARLDGMTEKPGHELAIAVAGPAVNVGIAVLLGLGLLVGTLAYPPLLQTGVGEFLWLLLALNVGMVIFNMVPAFPMDGGRVLRALLAWRIGQLRATRIAVWLGGVIALVGGSLAAFYLGNPWLLVIAAFIYLAGQAELRAVEMREHFRRVREQAVEPEIVEPAAERYPGYEAFVYRPRVTVWIWDPEQNLWVKQGNRGLDGVS